MELTCTVTGHRPDRLPFRYGETDPACVRLKAAITAQIADLAGRNVRHFITGMALGVDTWAAEAILDLTRDFPLTLTCALPCQDQARRWAQPAQERHAAILQRCDRVVTLFPSYVRGCMTARDRWMVEHADLLLAVYDGGAGGTAYTVRYAVSRGKHVLLLDPGTLAVSHV